MNLSDHRPLFWCALASLAALLSGCGGSAQEGLAWRLADHCSAPMPLMACEGQVLQGVAASDVGECCDICAQTSGCRAYSFWDALPPCPEGLACEGSATGACHGGTAGNHSCLDPSTLGVLQCDAGYSQCAFVDANQIYSTPGTCHLLQQCTTLKLTADKRLYSGTPFSPTSRQLPLIATCSTPVMGNLQACHGTALAVVETTTDVKEGMGKCCEECMKIPNCSVYTHYVDTDVWGEATGNATCHLMSDCVSKGATWGSVAHTGWAPPQPLDDAAEVATEVSPGYAVGRGMFQVPGYKCGFGIDTVVFFPIGEGPYGSASNTTFNVIVYGAGVWGFIDHNDELLETVARQGFIVIAPFYNTQGKGCHEQEVDILLALQYSREQGGSAHPALMNANFSSTGVLGMSMGGKGATVVGGRGLENVKAVVALGGARSGQRLKVPALFVTGSLDGIEPSTKVKKEFEFSPTYPKIYANLRNAFHTEAQEGRRMNELGGKFLACHVSGREDACAAIYESDALGIAAICRENEYSECIVKTNSGETVPPAATGGGPTATVAPAASGSLRSGSISKGVSGHVRWNLTRI